MINVGDNSGSQFIPYRMNRVRGAFNKFDGSFLVPKKDETAPNSIIYFFARYLAGGNNIRGKSIDIELGQFIDHMSGKKSKNNLIPVIARQSNQMIAAKSLITEPVTLKHLKNINADLVKVKNKQGLRNKVFWVGNKKTKPYAYQVCHHSMVEDLLNDFLVFLNDQSVDLLDRLLIGTHQFYAIHPFKDGNGRVWRAVFWSLLSAKYDEVQTLFIIFYFKLINYEGLYFAQKDLRAGKVESYVNFWHHCLEWSKKGLAVYNTIFLDEYGDKISQIYELDYWLKNEKRNVEISTLE